MGINYLGPTSEHSSLLTSDVKWADAVELSERSCLSVSDSMILNIVRCSKISLIVSNDFDIGYAVLSQDGLPDAVMTDKMAKEFKAYHF